MGSVGRVLDGESGSFRRVSGPPGGNQSGVLALSITGHERAVPRVPGGAAARAAPPRTRVVVLRRLFCARSTRGGSKEDLYDSGFYSRRPDPDVDPVCTSSGASLSRVLRGGSWDSAPNNLRCARRVRFRPNVRQNYNGFRVLLPAG